MIFKEFIIFGKRTSILFSGDSRKNIEETIAFSDVQNPELEKIIGEKPANKLT